MDKLSAYLKFHKQFNDEVENLEKQGHQLAQWSRMWLRVLDGYVKDAEQVVDTIDQLIPNGDTVPGVAEGGQAVVEGNLPVPK